MIWPSDLVFNPGLPIFKLDLETINIHVQNNFHDDWMKTVASIAMTRFFYDLTQWPSFDQRRPLFKPDLEIIKIHVHNSFHDDWVKNVTSTAMTRFFYFWAQWPTFWPGMTHFQTWPRNHQNLCAQQFSRRLNEIWDLYCGDKVFLWFVPVT